MIKCVNKDKGLKILNAIIKNKGKKKFKPRNKVAEYDTTSMDFQNLKYAFTLL